MDKTCDVLVLGGGGAGLTAAARIATLSDLKVTVLEKSDFLGGGAIQAGDYRVYNSQWQKARGLDDKLEEDLLKYMDDTNWMLDGGRRQGGEGASRHRLRRLLWTSQLPGGSDG